MNKFKEAWDALADVFETGFNKIEKMEITEEPFDMGPNHGLHHITIKFSLGYDGRPKVEENSIFEDTK